MTESKLWGGRFSEPTDELVERLNASVHFDKALAHFDILGSIAHATMLGEQGLIEAEDAGTIVRGLRELHGEIAAGRFEWRQDREDVHMNIEAALAERIGAAARRLHTARSRNDQVALDVRMWLRETQLDAADALTSLMGVFLDLARKNTDVLMPGYTHLQRAQPIVAGHHFLAYFEMFDRDLWRMLDGFDRLNILPLGAGALAATPHNINRHRVAELLKFGGITANSIDAVSDRDFAVEFMASAALCQVHLSRLSEELVLWMSSEFGFIRLPDAFCTGSSIMPQKKNPDIAELVRGKTGRMVGDWVALITALKGLPLAYNKDMQEDKEPLFDSAETLVSCLTVTSRMMARAEIRGDRTRSALDEGYLVATDLADGLVEMGVPFRDAHRIVGELVGICAERGVELADLPADEVTEKAGVEASLLTPYLDPRRSVERRDVEGGPAPTRVAQALAEGERRLQARRNEVGELRSSIRLDALLSPQ